MALQWNDMKKMLLTCSLCSRHFKDPKQLPCLHRFCRGCIKPLIDDSAEDVTCPLCQQASTKPAEGVDGLGTDFHTISLLEHIQLKETITNGEGRKCIGCSREIQIAAFCFKCKGFICKPCHELHETSGMLRDHRQSLLSLENVQAENLAVENQELFKCTPACLEHPDKVADICCSDCGNIPICTVCGHFEKHKGHSLRGVKELATEERATIQEAMKDLGEFDKSVREAPGRLEEAQKVLDNNIAAEEEKLRSQYDEELEAINSERRGSDADRDEEEDEEDLSPRRDILDETWKKTNAAVDGEGKEHMGKLKELAEQAVRRVQRFDIFMSLGSSVLASHDDWTDVRCLPAMIAASEALRDEARNEFPEIASLSDVTSRNLSTILLPKVHRTRAKTRYDFRSDHAYAVFIKKYIRVGMTVKCCKSHDVVCRGDAGKVIKLCDSELQDLTLRCQWKRLNDSSKVQYEHVEFFEAPDIIAIGDPVMVKTSAPSTQVDTAGGTHDSVGIIIRLREDEGTGEVQFPESKKWTGPISELKLLQCHDEEAVCTVNISHNELLRRSPAPALAMVQESLMSPVKDLSSKKLLMEAAGLKEEGNSAHDAGRYSDAIEAYTKAINITPQKSDEKAVFYKNRAACYLKLEDYQSAARDATAAIDIIPDDIKALFRLCQSLEKLGREDEAYEKAKKLVQLDPGNKHLRPMYGRLKKTIEQRRKEKGGRGDPASDVAYVKNHIKVGMKVRCCKTYELLKEGDTGTVIELDPTNRMGLTIRCLWKNMGRCFWAKYCHVEITDETTVQEIKVGSRVRVKRFLKRPAHDWGGATRDSVGTVTEICAKKCKVDFPLHEGWAGLIHEMELAPLKARSDFRSDREYSVYVREHIKVGMAVRCCTPHDVVDERDTGRVTKIDDNDPGQLCVRVYWKILEVKTSMKYINLELLGPETIKVGDSVRVKRSISEPKFKWGSVKQGSTGVVKMTDGLCCKVRFPEADNWTGLNAEMELVTLGTGDTGDTDEFGAQLRRLLEQLSTPGDLDAHLKRFLEQQTASDDLDAHLRGLLDIQGAHLRQLLGRLSTFDGLDAHLKRLIEQRGTSGDFGAHLRLLSELQRKLLESLMLMKTLADSAGSD